MGLGFRDSGLGSRVSGFEFWPSSFGSRVSGFRFRVTRGIDLRGAEGAQDALGPLLLLVHRLCAEHEHAA